MLDYRSLTTTLKRSGFQLNDLSLKIILNPNEYHLSSYMNPSTLKIGKEIAWFLIKTFGPLSRKIIPWLIASWVIVGKKVARAHSITKRGAEKLERRVKLSAFSLHAGSKRNSVRSACIPLQHVV